MFINFPFVEPQIQKATKPTRFVVNNEIVKQNLEEMFKSRRSTLLILPAISRQVLEAARRLPNCVLAGGAALALYTGDTNKIKDWDLFFSRSHACRYAYQEFKKLGFEQTNDSDWSITMEKSGVVVQLITKYYPTSVSKLFKSFDFTVCCFAIKGNDIMYTKQAAEDVEVGQFNYISSENPITTVKRIARYGQKGFIPTTQCIKDLLADCDYIPEDGDAES